MNRIVISLTAYLLLTGASFAGEYIRYGIGASTCRDLIKTTSNHDLRQVALASFIQGFVTASNGLIAIDRDTPTDVSHGFSIGVLTVLVDNFCHENPKKHGDEAVLAVIGAVQAASGD